MSSTVKKWIKLRKNLALRIKKTAIVKDIKTGFVFCSRVNHVVDPSILKDAAQITLNCFLKKLPQDLQPEKVIGVPNRGKEFATALGLYADLIIGVTERKTLNGQNNNQIKSYYDKREDMVVIDGIPSFTQGINYTHIIRGLRPKETVLVADDFCAYGHVAQAYNKSLLGLGIKPIFVFLVAKDFTRLKPPQIGFRRLRRAEVPAFAVVRFTKISQGQVAVTTNTLI